MPAIAAAMSSRLLGKGFHRNIQYSCTCDPAACEPGDECSISITQPLPAALFPDIYQLKDMARMSSSRGDAIIWNATLMASHDLEGIKLKSKPAVLVVQARSSVAHGSPDHNAVLRVPLHAHYAMPVNEPPPSATFRWALSPITSIALPSATMLLTCAAKSVWSDTTRQTPEDNINLWDLPAGSMSHGELVAFGTSVAVFLSCFVVLVEAAVHRLAARKDLL